MAQPIASRVSFSLAHRPQLWIAVPQWLYLSLVQICIAQQSWRWGGGGRGVLELGLLGCQERDGLLIWVWDKRGNALCPNISDSPTNESAWRWVNWAHFQWRDREYGWSSSWSSTCLPSSWSGRNTIAHSPDTGTTNQVLNLWKSITYALKCNLFFYSCSKEIISAL